MTSTIAAVKALETMADILPVVIIAILIVIITTALVGLLWGYLIHEELYRKWKLQKKKERKKIYRMAVFSF